jgi:16S rRNA (uracil1498-N3)-methyltransferase
MLDRFYLPGPPDGPNLNGPEVELTGSEARHLAQVLRKKPGEKVCLFDGCGRQATAEITSVGKHATTLSILETEDAGDPGGFQLTLASAAPKGERLRWLVEKATELGVDRLQLLKTERSIVHPADGKLDKLRQTVIAACKQSGRNRLMTIEPAKVFAEFLEETNAKGELLLADQQGEPFDKIVSSLSADEPTAEHRLIVAIGPEGGFTPDELSAAQASGARAISLGENILRIETAAVAVAARFAGIAAARDRIPE